MLVPYGNISKQRYTGSCAGLHTGKAEGSEEQRAQVKAGVQQSTWGQVFLPNSTQCPNSAHCHWKGLQQTVVGALSQLQQKGSPGHVVRSRSWPFHGEGRVMLVSQSSPHSCALCCSSARRLLACCPCPSSRGWAHRGFAGDLGGSPFAWMASALTRDVPDQGLSS